MIILKLYAHYKNFRPFTEQEAWALFKLAAFSEAAGWTLLIIGIIIRDIIVPGNEIAVQLAGRIHGTLFLLYIVAVLVLAPSLGWSWLRTIIAGLCSVPPYGSLLFEQVIASHRNFISFQRLRSLISYKILA